MHHFISRKLLLKPHITQLSIEVLQKMLTTNMSARMDTIEKLLRVYRGEEDLDRAMLQEIRSVSRFAYISTLLNPV